jgi:hypothetical protein
MSNLSIVLTKLQQERKRLHQDVQRLDSAIGALRGLFGRTQIRAGGTRPRLSLAARGRIAAAQRARWAKIREQKKAA